MRKGMAALLAEFTPGMVAGAIAAHGIAVTGSEADGGAAGPE